METDGINALNPAPDVGGILPPQINRPGPVIDYLTRPMVPSPASRRRDTLKGIAQFLPFISGELAKAEGDKLGVALSGIDFLGAAAAPAKAVVKKGIEPLTKKVEKPKKVKKLKPKETEQLFSGIESTKRESLDAPYKNPIIDLVNERPELIQISKSALDPNEDGVVSLFRVYNLKEGQELLPEKGIASLSTDVAPALAIGQKMEFIRGGGFNPMSLGPETPEFTIKRPAKLIRYEVPIDRVKAHIPSLLDQVPARTANAEKNYKFMSASDEKEVLADLSGIQPAEIFDVPFRAGARYFKGDIPAYRPSPYDIEKGEDPTRVLNYGLFRLFEEGRTPKGLMRDIMKSGSPKFRREPKSAYMSYKNYLAKVAADEANPSRRPGSFSGGEKTYAELNPGVSPYQLYGPEDYPMPIASRPRAKQDYQDLLDAFEEYKKIKGIGSL